jgi:hypothetical protein
VTLMVLSSTDGAAGEAHMEAMLHAEAASALH